MAKKVQSIIGDLGSDLTRLRMHFENVGSIFSGAAAPSALVQKALASKPIDALDDGEHLVEAGARSHRAGKEPQC